MVLSCTVCLFFLSLSHSAPTLPMLPLEFCGEVWHEETRVMGLSSSEDPMMIAWVVLTQCQRVTDRQSDGRTDGRTDGFTIANTALYIASYICWRAVKIVQKVENKNMHAQTKKLKNPIAICRPIGYSDCIIKLTPYNKSHAIAGRTAQCCCKFR